MKTKLLTTLILCSPLFLFAQGIGVGVKAGANFANLSSDEVDTKGKTGYHVGAYANIHFSEKFGITPEVLWSAQGGDLDEAEINTNYIAIPIMLRWRIIDLISLEAGPQFNVLTSAEADDVDVTDDFASPCYSAAFGAVCHLPLGFTAGLRYVAGLTDLSKNDEDKLKDQNFQIWVGWTILGAR